MRLSFAFAFLTLIACSQQPRVRVIAPHADTQALQQQIDSIAREVPVHTYEAHETTAADGAKIRYRLLRPRTISATKRYPLLILFHGSGAIGTDNRAQVGALAKSWARGGLGGREAFVLIPQFSERSAVYANESSTATQSLRNVLALIDTLKTTLPIDARRVHAVGFSMGGSAVWNAIALRPGLFASAAIVAGVPNADAIPALGRTRLLLVHGDADVENPFSATMRVFETAPRNRVTLWRYSGLAHEFPAQLIVGTELLDWLFGASTF